MDIIILVLPKTILTNCLQGRWTPGLPQQPDPDNTPHFMVPSYALVHTLHNTQAFYTIDLCAYLASRYTSIYLNIHSFIHLSKYIYVCPSIYLSSQHVGRLQQRLMCLLRLQVSIYLNIYPFIHLSKYISVYSSIYISYLHFMQAFYSIDLCAYFASRYTSTYIYLSIQYIYLSFYLLSIFLSNYPLCLQI